MTNHETRRYEMLQRVREFGEAHRDLFPGDSPGRQALDTVEAVVKQLGDVAVSKMSATREGRRTKTLARQALKARLDVVSRSARLMAAHDPGFDEQFKLPRPISDQAMVTAGRLFVRNAEAVRGRFIDYGLPATFVADLSVAVDEFEHAIRSRETAKDGHAAARASIGAALASGVAAVRRLEIVIAQHHPLDAATMVMWERDRRVDYPHRRRVVAPPADPEPAPETGASPPVVGS